MFFEMRSAFLERLDLGVSCLSSSSTVEPNTFFADLVFKLAIHQAPVFAFRFLRSPSTSRFSGGLFPFKFSL